MLVCFSHTTVGFSDNQFLASLKSVNLSSLLVGGMVRVRAVLVGLGHRTACYASYALQHPDEMEVVGLADPDGDRLANFAEKYNIPSDKCFSSSQELAAIPRFGDIAINGTMDEAHVETTIPLVEAGYHVLLEKPIAPNSSELNLLDAAVTKAGVKVVICHVLRYAPFYNAIQQRIVAGDIGEIIHIHSTENVSYHHMAVAFVRGKWNRREVNPIMLAKCCHDLDLICWFNSGIKPTKISSMGGRHFFTTKNAPEGAGENCFDCEIERDCQYSAKRHYIDNDWWSFYALAGEKNYEQGEENDTKSSAIHIAATDYGRCVWHSENDVADRQSVIIEFENGSIASHDLVSNSSRATRRLQIVGTKGEIFGDMTSGQFTLWKPAATDGKEYTQEVVDTGVSEDMHGGGDLRLVQDFLSLVRGEQPSLATTSLSDSLNSHRIAYAADISMQESRIVDFDDI